ncbi:dioxygenase [Nitzschia inconspicua]|uniref:Dioxygenase n=1 Tax=Nitzschia inconspicua TaxID=303405 RepID=A0A9K3PRJ0_9STRA|nr:dioxygenase [Nitzschia inconspicua]
MGAPMAGVSGAKLAFETCRAGGLGFIAAGHLNSKEAFKQLEHEIEIFKELAAKAKANGDEGGQYPLCIGFISHSTFKEELGWNFVQHLLEDYEPDVVQFFAPAVSYPPPGVKAKIIVSNTVKLCQSYGCKVVAQVGSVKEAIEALDCGVDCIVAQGSEAGGHGIRRDLGNGTLSLTSTLVKIAEQKKRKIPVLAAGGIVDGRGLVAALALGADGVVLGTRLWASNEAAGPKAYKMALVETRSCDDVVRTQVFDMISNSYNTTKWPAPYDSSGVLRNLVTDAWDTKLNELESEILYPSNGSNIAAKFRKAAEGQRIDTACVYSGQGVGEIMSIEPAYGIIQKIQREAAESMTRLQRVCLPRDD